MIHSRFERSVAGLQVGMFGGITLLASIMLISTLDRRPWWSFPNLMAAQFYGPRTITSPAGWHTISGIAFQLLLAGCAGALFGAFFGGIGSNRRITILGIAWGVALFYVSDLVYRNTSPMISYYIPRSASLVAHLMYGTCLAAIGRIGEVSPRRALVGGGPQVATSEIEAAAVSNPAAGNQHLEVARDAGSGQNGSIQHPAPEQNQSGK